MERARALGLLDAEADTVEELRELSRRERALYAEPPPVPDVRDIGIPGPESRLPHASPSSRRTSHPAVTTTASDWSRSPTTQPPPWRKPIYAERLRAAGARVELMPYPGQIHGFWSCGAITSLPREVNTRIAAALDGAA